MQVYLSMIHLTCAEQPRKLHQASPSRRKIKTPHKTRNKKKKDTTLASVSTFQCQPLLPASLGFQTFCNLKTKTQCLQTSSCLTKTEPQNTQHEIETQLWQATRGRRRQQEAISYYLDPTRNLHTNTDSTERKRKL
jgi:hypothetical protein